MVQYYVNLKIQNFGPRFKRLFHEINLIFHEINMAVISGGSKAVMYYSNVHGLSKTYDFMS